ncbi:MAG: hypothetical protein ABJE63_07850 [Lentilitoribacter sp.]
MRVAVKTVIFVGALSSLCVSAFAQNNKTAIKPWFQALSPVDREVISELLADDAQIELKDYDITQSKEEFVEALDNWEEAIESGSIAFKIDEDASSEENITTKVCYKFSSNELMTVETFEFSEGMIVKSVQETIADDCAEF